MHIKDANYTTNFSNSHNFYGQSKFPLKMHTHINSKHLEKDFIFKVNATQHGVNTIHREKDSS